jgi:hypothetical protein
MFTLLIPNVIQILYVISGALQADWCIYIYIYIVCVCVHISYIYMYKTYMYIFIRCRRATRALCVNDRAAMHYTCVRLLRTANCAAVDSLQCRGSLTGYWTSACSVETGWHLQIMNGMVIVMKSSCWNQHKGLHFACPTAELDNLQFGWPQSKRGIILSLAPYYNRI